MPWHLVTIQTNKKADLAIRKWITLTPEILKSQIYQLIKWNKDHFKIFSSCKIINKKARNVLRLVRVKIRIHDPERSSCHVMAEINGGRAKCAMEQKVYVIRPFQKFIRQSQVNRRSLRQKWQTFYIVLDFDKTTIAADRNKIIKKTRH